MSCKKQFSATCVTTLHIFASDFVQISEFTGFFQTLTIDYFQLLDQTVKKTDATMSEGTAVTGALSPEEMVYEVLETGIHHLSETSELSFLKNLYGGMIISAGGLLALLMYTGFPQATAENPGFKFLLEGAAFPVGLVVVYFLGAEL